MADEQEAQEARQGEGGGCHGAAGRLLGRGAPPGVYILAAPLGAGPPGEEAPPPEGPASPLFHRTPRWFPGIGTALLKAFEFAEVGPELPCLPHPSPLPSTLPPHSWLFTSSHKPLLCRLPVCRKKGMHPVDKDESVYY